MQDIHIGDEVRFLDSVGGGRVVRIDAARKLVYVEDADGFELPTTPSQVVVVHSTFAAEVPAAPAMQATSSDLHSKDTGTAHIVSKQERRAKSKKEAKAEDILEVDLHISALCDRWMQMEKHEIREYQLRVFQRTMRENLRFRGRKIVFIHGRGEGILKAAITAQLQKDFPSCDYHDASFAQYGFGATMVIIK